MFVSLNSASILIPLELLIIFYIIKIKILMIDQTTFIYQFKSFVFKAFNKLKISNNIQNRQEADI